MKDSRVWVGLFGIIPRHDQSLLRGRKGAYVNIVALAVSRKDFLDAVSTKLKNLGFDLFESEGVATFEQRLINNKIGDEVTMMRKSLSHLNSVIVGTFFTFDQDDT